jgi:hypothetical protein
VALAGPDETARNLAPWALSGTLGLLGMIALVGVLSVVGARLSGRLASQPTEVQPRRYAGTVVPIVLGYTVAHYSSLLMLDGQTTWIWPATRSGSPA